MSHDTDHDLYLEIRDDARYSMELSEKDFVDAVEWSIEDSVCGVIHNLTKHMENLIRAKNKEARHAYAHTLRPFGTNRELMSFDAGERVVLKFLIKQLESISEDLDTPWVASHFYNNTEDGR